MLPRREDFFLDVRRAVRIEQQPRVTFDADLFSEERISKALHGAALWLTPKVVEKYAPEEFEECPEDQQKRLQLSGLPIPAYRSGSDARH